MALTSPGSLLQLQERDDPIPGDGQIRVKVSACGVCRTDLHVVDAELPGIKYPVVPGHEIVGRVDLVGGNVTTPRIGDRSESPGLDTPAASAGSAGRAWPTRRAHRAQQYLVQSSPYEAMETRSFR
jgi:NADPH:quinone reductase-like Zn-dependent oxidoreductase